MSTPQNTQGSPSTTPTHHAQVPCLFQFKLEVPLQKPHTPECPFGNANTIPRSFKGSEGDLHSQPFNFVGLRPGPTSHTPIGLVFLQPAPVQVFQRPRQDMEMEHQAGKAMKWEAWEDRALARQVLADDPINCIRVRTPEKWLEVSIHLYELRPKAMNSTGESYRARMKKLVLLHRSEQSRSLHKTGADEEVYQFIQDMYKKLNSSGYSRNSFWTPTLFEI